jgi:putative salt-induced outer membrane protein
MGQGSRMVKLGFQSRKIIILWILFCPFLFANEYWQNEIDVGMLFYNGNNNAKHVNGSLLSEYQHRMLENSFRVTGLVAVNKNAQTNYKERNAEKYTFTDTIYYTFSPKHFSYVRGEGVKDHFSPYAHEFTESVGYGYHFFKSNNVVWQVSLGPGGRHNKTANGFHQDEFIAHLTNELYYEITTHTSFKQSLSIDASPINTKSHLINELKTALFGPVSTKISFELEHYVNLPDLSEYSKKTDATTKVTLSYTF